MHCPSELSPKAYKSRSFKSTKEFLAPAAIFEILLKPFSWKNMISLSLSVLEESSIPISPYVLSPIAKRLPLSINFFLLYFYFLFFYFFFIKKLFVFSIMIIINYRLKLSSVRIPLLYRLLELALCESVCIFLEGSF